MPDTYKEFKDLEKQILAVPELNSNEAVKATLKDINAKFDKDKNYFKDVGEIFTSLSKAIPKFTNPKSNAADIVSGVLEVTSSFLKVVGLIPGASVVTGPLSTALKLIGGVIGVFGSSSSNYNEQMQEMLDNAVSKLETDIAKLQISGVINKMQAEHKQLSYIISQKYDDPSSIIKDHPDYTTKSFNDIAETELGFAYDDLKSNIEKSKSGNWSNAASEFYSISQLVAFKVLFLLEAISYYELAEEPSGKFTLTNETKNILQDFMSKYNKKGEPYFIKPTIKSAAITHCLYRMSQSEFGAMAMIYDFLSSGKAAYWPSNGDNYRFSCSIPGKHDEGSKSASQCIRLTTLFAHRESDSKKNRSMAKPARTSTSGTNYDANKSVGLPQFMSNKDKDKNPQDTHFDIWANLNGQADKAPYYNWTIQAKNKHKEYHTTSGGYMSPGVTSEKDFLFHEENVYIFRVFPTDEEQKNIWPNDWKNKPDSKKSYVMIGSRGGDQVWATHHNWLGGSGGDDFRKASYYDIVYNSSSFGCPDQCMWYLMTENEQ